MIQCAFIFLTQILQAWSLRTVGFIKTFVYRKYTSKIMIKYLLVQLKFADKNTEEMVSVSGYVHNGLPQYYFCTACFYGAGSAIKNI